jgi:ornithine decarboxylase
MDTINHDDSDCKYSNIYQSLNILKKISNLDFDIKNIIDLLDNMKIESIETDHIKYYLSKSENPEALFLINISNIIKQLIKWYEFLPNVVPYYAVKCNPDPLIVKLLAKLGISFDCASIREIKQVLSETIQNDTNRIIYANPCKIISHLIEAKSLNVQMMTLDCVEELQKIHESFPNAELVIRLAVDDSNSICKFSSKFGCDLNTAYEIINKAIELKMNIIGVSFHVGSGCRSVESYRSAIEMASKVFDYGRTQGCLMNLLDIGGGFPGIDIKLAEIIDNPVKSANTTSNFVSFERIALVVNESIKKYFSNMNNKLRVIAEPGRYIVSSSHTLLVNVIGKKKKYLPSGEKCFSYYINDGVYGSFNCIYFDHYVPKLKLVDDPKSNSDFYKKKELYKSLIFGPTCDSMDVLFKLESYDDFEKKIGNNLLPELKIGDYLYIDNFGAYTISAGCEFNGIPRPKKIYFWSN